MFVIIGKIINTFLDKTKNDTPFTIVQVMSEDSKEMKIQNVTDWGNNKWEVGKEVKLKVDVRPWSNGRDITVTIAR